MHLVRFERLWMEDQEHGRVAAVDPVEACADRSSRDFRRSPASSATCAENARRRRNLLQPYRFPVRADRLIRGSVADTGRDVHPVFEGVAVESTGPVPVAPPATPASTTTSGKATANTTSSRPMTRISPQPTFPGSLRVRSITLRGHFIERQSREIRISARRTCFLAYHTNRTGRPPQGSTPS